MRGTRAKAIRRAVYGDNSTRPRNYYVRGEGGNMHQKVKGQWFTMRAIGQIVDDMRSRYQAAKREPIVA